MAPFTNGSDGGPDRDDHGRFVAGNRAAVGHARPFAAQAAALRRAFYEAVTPQDLQAIATQLLTQAKGGHLAATKLLLLWTLSKPDEPVWPDAFASGPADGREEPSRRELPPPMPQDREARRREAAGPLLAFIREQIPREVLGLPLAPEP